MNQVEIKLLPDGSGRVRIHWFVRDPKGPIKTAGSTTLPALGPLTLGGAMGRLACNAAIKDVAPQFSGGVWRPCVCSDDVRAVSCPECQAVPEYETERLKLKEILEPDNPDLQLQLMAQKK